MMMIIETFYYNTHTHTQRKKKSPLHDRWGTFICILPHYMVRGNLNGAPLIMGLGRWKETSWAGPYIKFGVNPMPLTHSSVARKFKEFILKEDFPSIQRSNPFG